MRSIRRALAGILVICDEQYSKDLAADVWIRGWERPLLNVNTKAIVTDRPSSSDLTAVFDEFLAQVQRSLDAHTTGPDAFNQLLCHICSQFDHGDVTAALQRSQTFGVANGTPFSDYVRYFRVVVFSVTCFQNSLAPHVSTLLELVRRNAMDQYPGFTPTLYPGALTTAPEPFVSIDAVWLSFQTMATNRAPALSGEKYVF